jgi:hypothetical protein
MGCGSSYPQPSNHPQVRAVHERGRHDPWSRYAACVLRVGRVAGPERTATTASASYRRQGWTVTARRLVAQHLFSSCESAEGTRRSSGRGVHAQHLGFASRFLVVLATETGSTLGVRSGIVQPAMRELCEAIAAPFTIRATCHILIVLALWHAVEWLKMKRRQRGQARERNRQP